MGDNRPVSRYWLGPRQSVMLLMTLASGGRWPSSHGPALCDGSWPQTVRRLRTLEMRNLLRFMADGSMRFGGYFELTDAGEEIARHIQRQDVAKISLQGLSVRVS